MIIVIFIYVIQYWQYYSIITITMSYIKSSGFIYFITRNLCILISFAHGTHLVLPLPPGNHQSVLCILNNLLLLEQSLRIWKILLIFFLPLLTSIFKWNTFWNLTPLYLFGECSENKQIKPGRNKSIIRLEVWGLGHSLCKLHISLNLQSHCLNREPEMSLPVLGLQCKQKRNSYMKLLNSKHGPQ